jgi:UDP-sugar diphosphatase
VATDKIKIISIEECKNPEYIKPKLVTFEHNGVLRDWEIADTHDSVAILLYHRDKDALILVKQFRPAIFIKYGKDGHTHELCAGLVDKDKSLEVIAKEEILEECGYDVSLDDIELINSFNTAVGFAGGRQTLFYAEVDDSMRVSDGGGIDDEQIEVVYLPVSEARDFMFDEDIVKTPGLLYGFMWFFEKS